MGTYASTSDVQARIPYRTIDANSNPSSTQVSAWIDEAEAALEGAVLAAGGDAPITDTRGIKQMRAWALDYAVGMTLMAYASTGGEGGADDGTEMITRFWDRVDDIQNNPARYSAMLNSGSSLSGTRVFRSYVSDNTDGRSVSNGDFDPSFTKSDGGDQF